MNRILRFLIYSNIFVSFCVMSLAVSSELILQTKKPDDFVIATKKQFSVKYFINLVAKELKIKIYWKRNKFKREFAVDEKNNVNTVVKKNTLNCRCLLSKWISWILFL